MTDSVSLTVFDDAVIRAIADENDVPETELREALADHQQTMATNPGVEDLVYEWRKRFDDPVLHRTPEVFVLGVPPTVWEEFRDHLGFEEHVFTAVTAVHQEQTLRTDEVAVEEIAPDHVAIVVAR
ncbi:hypothetical protein [Haloarcula sp. JP-L23]|uniref:hypothetical protein n=1 Tax=Haloarcula sp. JP-L23 TaxID=2716717 RepID=UPI00140EE04C|nr:hypothetical protein G9465_11530 [Haloarcula sp. JP-L23]